ncbi:MAG: cation transporter, partial [Prevotella sp.]
IWAISTTRNALTCHVVMEDITMMEEAKREIKSRLKKAGIAHATIEMESGCSHCEEHECGCEE